MSDSGPSHAPRSRRGVLTALGSAALAATAGCSSTDLSSTAETDPGTSSGTSTESKTASSTPRTGRVPLETARSALDAAFTEIYSVELVNYEEKVWTPRFEDLGNMDPDVVETHVNTAHDALVDATEYVEDGSKRAVRAELLRHVASIAEHGAEFYRSFALTFEKVYQYEFYIDEKSDYERAVEKMGVAREKLATWPSLGEQLTEAVKAIKQLYDEYESVEARVPAFDIGRWNYTTFGVEQYAYLLEPRFVAFEAYAEAVAADLDGLDHLEAEEWQAAQESFKRARRKIQQADIQFSEADSRGDSFFDRRARVYENRAPMFDDGYLLHLRAANEFVRGNTENANDLRFQGTTTIRNAFAKYPIGVEETGTPTPS